MTEGKVNKSVRLPSDIAVSVERYAADRDISESDALRRLVLYGLEREENGYQEQINQIHDAVTTPAWKRMF